jgi:8-oxo-dGTP pyrophosphatase MutT (NUDIX family)
VLLLDREDRALLFRAVNPATGVAFWFPPGGEIEPGESVADAARRELAEETGFGDLELGPEIWARRHVFPWLDETIDQRERWFLARVDHFDIDTSGWTDAERRDLNDHRWWTIDELHAATEHLVPLSLAADLEALLADGPPSTPIEIGV